MSNKCKKILEYVKDKIRDYSNPIIEDILVFGSVLNGNCTKTSDLDLLLVFKGVDFYDFNDVKNSIFHYKDLLNSVDRDLNFLLGKDPVFKKEFELQIVGSYELRKFSKVNDILSSSLMGSVSLNPRDVNETLFHLSFRDFKSDNWKPRLPHGSKTNKSINNYPESPIERISFSPTIEGCFRAIYPNISHLMEGVDELWIDMVLYKAVFNGDERIVTPDQLTNKELVWDAHVTNEYWVLDEVKVEKVSNISFKNTSDEVMLTRPFNDSKNKPEVVGPLKVEYKLESATKKNRKKNTIIRMGLRWRNRK